MKKIVCLGGGNAMPKVVLAGLKNYPVKITAICSTLDSGGSSGRLRRDFKTISFGDIRRALIYLSSGPSKIKDVFNFRFTEGELKGHNLGNIILLSLFLLKKNYEKVLREIKKLFDIRYDVLPATISNSNLFSVLENGRIIKGETNIDIPKHNPNLKIKRVFLKPRAIAFPKSIEAIKKADLITIGPGDLYSSLAQIFLVNGISETIKKSRAKKVLICNLMTKHGETNNFSVLDFKKEIEKYLGVNLDYVIYNNFFPPRERIKRYKKNHPLLLNLVKVDENLPKTRFIGKNLLLKKGPIEHDPQKLAKIIFKLCKH